MIQVLHNIISKHKKFLEKEDIISSYLKNRIKSETIQILRHKLTKKVEELINSNEIIEEKIDQVIDKTLNPYSMANLIIKMIGLDD